MPNLAKKDLFELFTEIVGWLQIVASPFLTGLAIGLIIYFSSQNKAGFIIAILVATIGLITGIVWANRVWKKQGTIHFMSGIKATPELDKIKDENEN
ncbi:hypothetical protein [Terrimonas alba]|uniref:hypothetical protein n=1 Tax=Terrimonas alba TaxID=3349636 RepID=UPI0035F4F075